MDSGLSLDSSLEAMCLGGEDLALAAGGGRVREGDRQAHSEIGVVASRFAFLDLD